MLRLQRLSLLFHNPPLQRPCSKFSYKTVVIGFRFKHVQEAREFRTNAKTSRVLYLRPTPTTSGVRRR
jgi:hypothetical protein